MISYNSGWGFCGCDQQFWGVLGLYLQCLLPFGLAFLNMSRRPHIFPEAMKSYSEEAFVEG